MIEIPTELAATVEMIRRAYSATVPAEDYQALVYLLYNEGEMSLRQTSRALGAYFQRDDVYYIRDAELASREGSVPQQDLARVRNKLLEHGYAAWLAEE